MAVAAPSITATNAGNVTHPSVTLGGPIFILLRIIGYGALIAAVAVVIDALRRPASHFGGNGARRWMWAGPQLLLLVLIAIGWVLLAFTLGPASVTAPFAGFLAIYLFFCVILQVAYLLVVVAPRRREPIPEEVEKALPGE